jgi:septal ring factor EnvC (AmiA/AmiB activator)
MDRRKIRELKAARDDISDQLELSEKKFVSYFTKFPQFSFLSSFFFFFFDFLHRRFRIEIEKKNAFIGHLEAKVRQLESEAVKTAELHESIRKHQKRCADLEAQIQQMVRYFLLFFSFFFKAQNRVC